MATYRNYFEAVMADFGKEVKTTFWDDFSIADRFGLAAIKDTYKRAFKGWRHDTEYITELSMVLNHKIWYYYERGDMEKARLYDSLWKDCDGWCMDNLKGDAINYYIQTTD